MGEKILIVADAGGTKTEWRVKAPCRNQPVLLSTRGINASVSSEEEILNAMTELKNSLIKEIGESIGKGSVSLHFYGAGCNSKANCSRVIKSFKKLFPTTTELNVRSDLEGAARALFGDQKGIACILGTGSASCLFDGNEIVDSVPSLGYILGDEGSGASMGRMLLNSYFKRELKEETAMKLERIPGVTLSEVLQKVYRSSGAAAYMASFVPFIKENEKEEGICSIIDHSLKLFFNKNVLKYNCPKGEKIRFAGSVSMIFAERIKRIAHEYGYDADLILQKPIERLGAYHDQKLL